MIRDDAGSRPAVASVGGNYVVGEAGITIATRAITPTSTGTTTSVPTATSIRFPGLAPSGAGYLLTWTDVNRHGIAQRLDATGALVGDPFTVAPDGTRSYWAAGNAWNGATNLVAWAQERVWATRVSPSGTVLDAGGIALGLGGLQPTVASDGADFLVAWIANGDVLGSEVSASGSAGDPTGFAISTSTHDDATPDLAFDATTGGYAITYATNHRAVVRLLGVTGGSPDAGVPDAGTDRRSAVGGARRAGGRRARCGNRRSLSTAREANERASVDTRRPRRNRCAAPSARSRLARASCAWHIASKPRHRRWNMVDSGRFALIVGMGSLALGCVGLEEDTGGVEQAAGVTREETGLLVVSGDPDRGLFVTGGLAAEHVPTFCTGEIDRAWVDVVDAQTLVYESGVVAMRLEGDLHTVVHAETTEWEYSTDWGAFFAAYCDAVLAAPPLATGITHGMFLDHNVMGEDVEQGNHWGLKMQGKVEDTDGTIHPFVHAGQCNMPDATGTQLRCNVSIRW